MSTPLWIDGFNPDLKTLLEGLGVGFVMVDQHETIQFINSRAAEIFGYSKKELNGSPLKNFMSDEDYQKVLQQTSERKNGKVSSYHHQLIRKDGSIRFVQSTVTPFFVNNAFTGAYGILDDLTESIDAAMMLEESERRFRMVSDSISDFAISFKVGINNSLSAEWHSGLLPIPSSMSRDAMLTFEAWFETCHPDDLMTLQNAFDALLQEREPLSFEFRIRTGEQSHEWFEVVANPEVEQKTTRIGRIIFAGRNINKQKLIEQELLLTKYMVDNASLATFITRSDSTITYLNDFACSMLGYSRKELIGKPVSTIDPSYKISESERIWNDIKARPNYSRESQAIKKDGSILDTEVSINLFIYQNEELAVSFVKDISIKKQYETTRQLIFGLNENINNCNSTEEIFRAISDVLSTHFGTKNIYLTIPTDSTNSLFYYLSDNGIKVEERSIAGTPDELVLSEKKTIELHTQRIRELVQKGVLTPNNSPTHWWAGIPIIAGTSIMGIIGFLAYDPSQVLTDQQLESAGIILAQTSLMIRRRMDEERLKLSEANLREANLSKDKFFSIIAHDLRGPFNAIIGFSDILHNDFETLEVHEQREMIKNVHEASVRTFKLLENLLEWSRIQTGRTIPHPESIDLSAITNSVLGVLKSQAEKKNIKLFSGVSFGTLALCDEYMIQTVVRNLISNAIKFTNPGGSVRIWSKVHEHSIDLTVSDNGVGISEENQKKLFRMDESIKTRGTDGEQGTGLGLLLCREFIGLNRGKISVSSEPNKGSQFTLTLPKSTI